MSVFKKVSGDFYGMQNVKGGLRFQEADQLVAMEVILYQHSSLADGKPFPKLQHTPNRVGLPPGGHLLYAAGGQNEGCVETSASLKKPLHRRRNIRVTICWLYAATHLPFHNTYYIHHLWDSLRTEPTTKCHSHRTTFPVLQSLLRRPPYGAKVRIIQLMTK